MNHYDYATRVTCARRISLDLDGDRVHNISFMGGCPGNLKMISKLLEGWTVDAIEQACSGNLCGSRGTSCADQLAKAVRAAYNAQESGE